MEATELRIGNWYYEMSLPKQVAPMLILNLLKCELENKIAIDVTPIPLTPKILRDSGFIWDGNWEKDEFAIDKSGFPLTYGNEYRIGIKLEYVHQLQNLYFALTGEELTINL